MTRRILPSICVGSTCKHHACCWKFHGKFFVTVLSIRSHNLNAKSRIVDTRGGYGGKGGEDLVIFLSRVWYLVCPTIVAIPHKENWRWARSKGGWANNWENNSCSRLWCFALVFIPMVIVETWLSVRLDLTFSVWQVLILPVYKKIFSSTAAMDNPIGSCQKSWGPWPLW